MLKILQVRLQQYLNHKLPDVQAGFRKGRGTRDQIAKICWIIEKAKEYQKNTYFCFINYAKAFVQITANWNILAAAAAKSLLSYLTLCYTIDGSPNRLLCSWDCPGKNTGVGCHFHVQGVHAC